MNRLLSSKRVIVLLTLPALIVYTLILPYPLLRTLYLSFTQYNLLSPATYIGLQNYTNLFTGDPEFVHSLVNTFYLTAGCVVLQLPLAFLLAFWLGTGSLRGTRFFRSVYFFPVAISGAAVGLIWQFLYQPKLGLIDAIVRVFGFKSFSYAWLASPHVAIWAVVISVSWQYFGYHLLIFTAGMSTIPTNLLDAARVDGAGEWRQATRIVLPMMKPFVVVSFILITTSSISSFANVISLTDGGPGTSSTVLALEMYQNAFFYSRYGYGAAIGVVLTVLNILVTVVIGYGVYGARRRQSLASGE
jgi:raffinose/stachyose/melibiose transport system permease protein